MNLSTSLQIKIVKNIFIINMVKITKQDKEILYNYSEVFERISVTKTLRGATRKDSKIIVEIVNKYSDEKKQWNLSCNSCVYSLWLRASKLYFSLKENDEKRTDKKKQPQEVES